MRKWLLASCCLVSTGLFAQNANFDSTYRPGSYKLRAEQFRAFPNSKKDIVFLGNSITAGVDWMELLGEPRAKNRGISGDITYGVLERLDEVTEGQPAKVFILIGTNDISRNIPDHIIIENHRRIVQRIKAESPRTKIYFQTILPVNNTFPAKNHFNKDEHIAAVNDAIRSLAATEGITVIDLHKEFLDSEGRLAKELTYDGLHLNMAGYLKWAEILKKGKYLK